MTTCKPWFNTADVEEMYDKVGGPENGKRSFMAKAKQLAVKNRGAFLYKNEAALFDLFKRELPLQIAQRKIKYWGELVQLIS